MKVNFTVLLFVFGLVTVFSQSDLTRFNYDKNADRKATVVNTQLLDSVTSFEKIVLEGFDSKIPFYHYKNTRNNNGKYVILLHGLGDSKEDWIYPSEPYLDWSRNTTAIKDSLVSLGYSLIIPDVKFHGERSYELNFRSPAYLPPARSKNEKDSKLFETLITSTVKDLRILMDYIENRNHQQKHDFGVIGYSLGGNLAILLSVADKRLSAVVGCVPPINLPARSMEMFEWPEDIIERQLNITPMKHAASITTPTLMLMGKKDYYSPEQEVSDFFENVAAKEKKLKYFDSGHILPNAYRVDAIAWITQYN